MSLATAMDEGIGVFSRDAWHKAVTVTLLLASLVITPALVVAQDKKQADFCTYTTQLAEAEHTHLRSPTVDAGISAPITNTYPSQSFVGLVSSPTDIRKSQLVMAAARKQCALYDADQAAQMKIQYSAAAIEKEALANRMDWLRKAEEELTPLLQSETDRLAMQDSTIENVYGLQAALAKVQADKMTTELSLTALYVPSLSDTPLRELVAGKQSADLESQKATTALSEQDNYSVILEAGVHEPVRTLFRSGADFYGNFTVKWNVSSRSRSRSLSNAVAAYGQYIEHDENGVARKAQVLQEQLTAAIAAQESALKALLAEGSAIQVNLTKIGKLDTAAAISFKNTLVIDNALLQVEIGATSFRIEKLRAYLKDNF